jgi:hypothetical protein
MSNIVKILYDGVDAFHPQPTPFVGLDYSTIYAGERWGQQEIMTLNGQITGCTFEKILSGYNDLTNRFKKNYQDLEIWQIEGATSGMVFRKELVEIQSISVPDNRWLGAMPYTISLTCYPANYFSGVYGVLEPQDSWAYSEQQNATMDISHTISCRPFNTSKTSNNAIENARTWAFSRSGTSSAIAPLFISGTSIENFFLVSQNESIDRFNGRYSLNESYSNDLARSGYGVIRYSTTIDSGNNLVTVSLNGTAQGQNNNIDLVRTAFNRIDKLAIAAKQYKDVFGMSDLNPIPLTKNFSEDPQNARIDFSYNFNNDNRPEITFDYNVSLSTELNGNIPASIDGTVRVRGGSLSEKLAKANAYADTVNLYNLILPFYNAFDASAAIAPLNPIPISNGRSTNQSNGTVALSASYDNKDRKSSVFDEFNFTLDFAPSVMKVDSQPVLDGYGRYSVVNLGYANRAILSINGTARVGQAYTQAIGESVIKQTCFALFSQYGSMNAATLDKNTVTSARADGRVLSFSFSWSFDSYNKIGPTTISTLSVR